MNLQVGQRWQRISKQYNYVLEITKLHDTPGYIGQGKYLTSGGVFRKELFVFGAATGIAINFPKLGEIENDSWKYLKGQDKI
jgi:hypothetical protein